MFAVGSGKVRVSNPKSAFCEAKRAMLYVFAVDEAKASYNAKSQAFGKAKAFYNAKSPTSG